MSYILIAMVLLSAWIALLSEWKYMSSIKPCNLVKMTLDELYNKSHERFMLNKCQKNAPMDQKDNLSFIVILLWSKYNSRFYTSFEVGT
jgi:hypothetical protein